MKRLLGNESAYATLAAWVRGGRFPHSLLVEGEAGSGKKTFARNAAQALLCGSEGERPCGECRHCIKVEKGIHPDLMEFGGEGGAKSFHIDVVRGVRQQAYVRPNEADRKVFLLCNVQNMSVQAQNALLKIIEEPPVNVHFFLTCENKATLLETILSRVAVVTLGLPGIGQCAGVLQELLPSLDGAASHDAALACRGNVGKALHLLENEGGNGELAAQLLQDLCTGKELAALAALARFDRDREGLVRLLETMRGIAAATVTGDRQWQDEAVQKRVTPLRWIKILGIIDGIQAAGLQNANASLMGCALCAKIRAALSD